MERNIEVNGTEIIGNVFGSFDENIKLIENELDVAVVNRDGKIKVCGGEENTESAEKVIKLQKADPYAQKRSDKNSISKR